MLLPNDGQSGGYPWPEVGFGEIAIDLLQARFWMISGWMTAWNCCRMQDLAG